MMSGAEENLIMLIIDLQLGPQGSDLGERSTRIVSLTFDCLLVYHTRLLLAEATPDVWEQISIRTTVFNGP